MDTCCARRPVPAIRVRPAVVRGVRCARRILEAAVCFPYTVALQELRQYLGAGPGVVANVPLELLEIEETSPNAPVHLHDTEVAALRLQKGHLAVDLHELPPTALLPGGGAHQVGVEALEAGFERVGAGGPWRDRIE